MGQIESRTRPLRIGSSARTQGRTRKHGPAGEGDRPPHAEVSGTMTRFPIAVCMISASEAHRIGKALASVAGWTNEIVVVLNEDVADGTDKVAAKFGAK